MMYGIDISNWQKGIDLTQGKYDFCICKATEGTWYVDPQLHNYIEQLTKLNKLIGVYHFARQDKDSTVEKMKEEADFFISTVEKENLIGKAILCLDWETNPMDEPKLMEAWVTRVYERTRVVPFVYCSKSKFQSWLGKPEWKFLEYCKLWIAQWPYIKSYIAGVDPNLKLDFPYNYEWSIWQYSSNGQIGAGTMRIDLDMSSMTPTEWKWSATGTQKENLTPDMEWAISAGLFYGYGDGTYRPDEPITRAQAASLFKRYTDYITRKLEK